MVEALAPVDRADIDPRLRPHLAPDETVLWQGAPAPGAFFGTRTILIAGAFIVPGLLLASGLVGANLPLLPRLVPALAAIGGGTLFLVTRWNRRAALWSYAITDRRLLSVLKGRIVRSVTPDVLERCKLRIRGGIVYWMEFHDKERTAIPGETRGPDGYYAGFHGQADPQATKELIEAWRQRMSSRADAGVAALLAQSRDRDPDSVPAAGIQRVRHPATGLGMDVPADWAVTVETRYDGPLRVFGVTLLPRIIRNGRERRHDGKGDWNFLTLRAGPNAALEMTIHDRPLGTTLDRVMNDPMTTLTRTDIQETEIDLRVGSFRGFSVTRRMPSWTQAKTEGARPGPAILHQVWLGRGDISVEIQAYVLERRADMRNAMEAVIRSIRVPE